MPLLRRVKDLLLHLKERPRSATAPPSPENLRDELNSLAALASELEQQVDELERQQLSSAVEPGRSSSPSQHEKSASPSLRHQEELGRIGGIALAPWRSFYRKIRIYQIQNECSLCTSILMSTCYAKER